MKNYISLIIITLLAVTSCTDVVEVDVPTAETRLVVEASLDWEKGTAGNVQSIELSTSTPYFDLDSDAAVDGAQVNVTDLDSGDEFLFEGQGNGLYTTSNFIPVLYHQYQLEIIYDNETYLATETLYPVSDIKALTQSTEGGFDDEFLELNLYFDDPEEEENFYLIRYQEEGDPFPDLEDQSDEFTNGNEQHDFYEKDDDEDNNEQPFEPGDTVFVDLYGISEQYYNYIRLLIEQYYSAGDPFGAVPAPIKGNCINQDNPANFAYGYFRVTQVSRGSYTFQ
ncbi:hypothetical protein Murru_3374 [Allomuricauda ruestringensis DSM 13258]|uniref:DUF4249 domain-containing protein n=1 Tax=Allomuricauda ruestringensis (strain DSM 13258 / CIP 107369 / LMG 19739 / B1) TaxID=886377 RepID=G2PN40_ALLRU|nr:DUF4249 domain-containing protein [Allomuricauda ruestringensis]AEM72388.1 hypothetical protein Murru_3374 [Allomuricauda ruestringensis DSM 13258]